MSVYTSISRQELEQFLTLYPIGELVEFQGIKAGIENTNYFVTTTTGEYVLTIFEAHSQKALQPYLDLMGHLAEHSVPTAHPIQANSNVNILQLKQKPAALVKRLSGSSLETTNIEQCRALGSAMAQMHIASKSFDRLADNSRGAKWRLATGKTLLDRLPNAEQTVLQEELRFQALYRLSDIPHGNIHADLFRDNALFNHNELTGILDWYYAGFDSLLYDLAVVVNDWCNNHDNSLDIDKAHALLRAYHELRPLTSLERGAWPVLLRAAALRFWLSRLVAQFSPPEGELTFVKDPAVFYKILQNHIGNKRKIMDGWV